MNTNGLDEGVFYYNYLYLLLLTVASRMIGPRLPGDGRAETMRFFTHLNLAPAWMTFLLFKYSELTCVSLCYTPCCHF